MVKRLIKQAVLGAALVALLVPTSGCKDKWGRHSGGSYTDVFFELDWLPSFGGFDVVETYDSYEFYEEDVVIGGDAFYDDAYYYEEDVYEDAYWDDDLSYWDDDWKKKRRDP